MTGDVLYLRAICCTAWPIVAGPPLRPCGFCGKVPAVVGEWKGTTDLTDEDLDSLDARKEEG